MRVAPQGVDTSVALPGYVFLCSKQTFPECIDRMLMGGPGGNMRSLSRIVPEWTQVRRWARALPLRGRAHCRAALARR